MSEVRAQGLDVAEFTAHTFGYVERLIDDEESTPLVARKLERGWYWIDPITAHTEENPEVRRSFAQALRLGAAVCRRTARQIPEAERIGNAGLAMSLDSGYQFAFVGDSEEASKQFKLVTDALSPDMFTAQMLEQRSDIDDYTSLLSMRLSARMGEIYRALCMAESQGEELKSDIHQLVRALLGGLIHEAVGHATVLNEYRHKARSVSLERIKLHGSLYELVELTYSLIRWHAEETLCPRIIRPAFLREDCPRSTYSPLRSFDLVDHSDNESLYIQLKTGSHKDGEYAKEITLVKPRQLFSKIADGIIDDLQCVIAPDSAKIFGKKGSLRDEALERLDQKLNHQDQGWIR